jgi:hypothetical protein
VLALGYRKQDMFTARLSTPAMMAIAYACHPGTAVHHSLTEGWPIEAHLLANLSEQSAGMIAPAERYTRPGMVKAETPLAEGGFSVFGSIAEYEAHRQTTFKEG